MEFRTLLGKCRCGLVMTRRSFKYHRCEITRNAARAVRSHHTFIDLTRNRDDSNVIDLTSDDSQN
jgi:hypothetical protein